MNNKIPLSLGTTSAKSLFKVSPSRSFPVSQSSWYYPSEDKHQFIGQKACAWRLPKFGNIRKSAIRPNKISEGHLREEGFVILHPMGSLSSHHPTFFGADRICQRHICTPNNRGKELCARLLAAVVGSYLPTLPTTYAETAMKIYQCGGREMMHGRHIA